MSDLYRIAWLSETGVVGYGEYLFDKETAMDIVSYLNNTFRGECFHIAEPSTILIDNSGNKHTPYPKL
jgi:hypothetical protein